MYKLPLPFTLLTYCGYWRPTKWPIHSFKYWLYNVYSLIMIALIYFLAFFSCVDSLTSKDLNTLTDKLSVSLSILRVSVQLSFLFFQREQIISLLDILQKGDWMPKDNEEATIKRKTDKFARKLTIYCEVVNELSVFFSTVGRYHKVIRTRTFPIFDWLPYNVTSTELYVISLLNQTIALMVCATASVAIETMIAGLMMEARIQFDMFCHRARNLPATLTENEENNLSKENLKRKWHEIRENLVKYHQEIIDFVHGVNATFKHIIVTQFLVSSSVLCLTIYQMSTLDLFNTDMIFRYFYLNSMLMEVYLYCWFGNEVTLKSNEIGDAVYEMDWTILPVDIVKDLLLIMTRSRKPAKISCSHVLILSLESFVSIMKFSYSSYNLMKTSDDA